MVSFRFSRVGSEIGMLGGLRHTSASTICSMCWPGEKAKEQERSSVGGLDFGENDDRGKRVEGRE